MTRPMHSRAAMALRAPPPGVHALGNALLWTVHRACGLLLVGRQGDWRHMVTLHKTVTSVSKKLTGEEAAAMLCASCEDHVAGR